MGKVILSVYVILQALTMLMATILSILHGEVVYVFSESNWWMFIVSCGILGIIEVLEGRRQKLEVEHFNLQNKCSHNFKVVNEYQEDYWDGADIEFYDAFDLFCPICEETLWAVDECEKDRIINTQNVRKNYEKENE